ncbi:MAG TPA: hypothetical protein VMV79_07490, partial [Alphaproteobacteria bacterium]|nr:hypothetical protein [Alphaproteobacteria bacterium]
MFWVETKNPPARCGRAIAAHGRDCGVSKRSKRLFPASFSVAETHHEAGRVVRFGNFKRKEACENPSYRFGDFRIDIGLVRRLIAMKRRRKAAPPFLLETWRFWPMPDGSARMESG